MPSIPTASKSRDIFRRCYEYTKPDELRALGIYPYFTVFSGYSGDSSPVVTLDGKQVLMFGSNNYLGLTTHPKVKEASIEAIKRYGTGNSGSRMLNGSLDIHQELESKLAEFTGKESALLFSTGFMTNGCLSSLIGRDDIAILDKEVHASILYATMAGVTSFTKNQRRFRHNDVDDLRAVLESVEPDRGKIVVVDGVFSMMGDLAPLDRIAELCREFGARLFVDEAHGMGVLGEHGIGTVEHFNVVDDTDIVMATFSKAFASTGGFVAAERPVIEYLKHHSMPFIYSASMPAPSVAAALASLEIIKNEPERRQRLLANAKRIRDGLAGMGFDVVPSVAPVIPVVIDDEEALACFFKGLLAAGVYTNPIFRPAAERCLIRISCMAIHEDSHIDQLLDVMLDMGRKSHIIP